MSRKTSLCLVIKTDVVTDYFPPSNFNVVVIVEKIHTFEAWKIASYDPLTDDLTASYDPLLNDLIASYDPLTDDLIASYYPLYCR